MHFLKYLICAPAPVFLLSCCVNIVHLPESLSSVEINRFIYSHFGDIVDFIFAYDCLFSSKLGFLIAKYATTMHLIPEYRKLCYVNEQRFAMVRVSQGGNSQQAVFKEHIFQRPCIVVS
jgi:hypothetical protein